jgi:hypothetical protein
VDRSTMRGGISGINNKKQWAGIHRCTTLLQTRMRGGFSGMYNNKTMKNQWLLGGFSGTISNSSIDHTEVSPVGLQQRSNGGVSGTCYTINERWSHREQLYNGSHGGVSGDYNNEHPVGTIHRCTVQRMNGGFSSITKERCCHCYYETLGGGVSGGRMKNEQSCITGVDF